MSNLLEKAIKKLKSLPPKQQEDIAGFLFEEFGWDYSFKNSQKQLSVLASEALEEYKKGKTKPLSF